MRKNVKHEKDMKKIKEWEKNEKKAWEKNEKMRKEWKKT